MFQQAHHDICCHPKFVEGDNDGKITPPAATGFVLQQFYSADQNQLFIYQQSLALVN